MSFWAGWQGRVLRIGVKEVTTGHETSLAEHASSDSTIGPQYSTGRGSQETGMRRFA